MRNNFFLLLIISLLFPLTYTDYGFEIFSLSGDAKTQSLGGISANNSMSLVNSYSLNNFHKTGRSLFSYGTLYDSVINYFQFSYIIANYNKSKIGLSLLSKSIDGIPNTKEAWNDIGLPISQDNIDYDKISYYKDNQLALIFFYSFHSLLGDISFKLKPIYTSLLVDKAYGLSLDFGFSRSFNSKATYRIMINDLVSYYSWNNSSIYSIYPKLRSSIVFKNNNSSLYTELFASTNISSVNPLAYRFGYEYLINDTFAMRCGYSNIKSFSLGFGFIYNYVEYSYSFNPNLSDIILGHDHHFSILLDLKKEKNG